VPLSALSNTVALSHLSTSPNLPTSGNNIVPKLMLAALSAALGVSLMLAGRRRRRPC
jgi:putative exporter of polyketide antibiotics